MTASERAAGEALVVGDVAPGEDGERQPGLMGIELRLGEHQSLQVAVEHVDRHVSPVEV